MKKNYNLTNITSGEIVGVGLVAILITIALVALILGIDTLVIYMVWNFVCDVFGLTLWINWLQSFGVAIIATLVKGLFSNTVEIKTEKK